MIKKIHQTQQHVNFFMTCGYRMIFFFLFFTFCANRKKRHVVFFSFFVCLVFICHIAALETEGGGE